MKDMNMCLYNLKTLRMLDSLYGYDDIMNSIHFQFTKKQAFFTDGHYLYKSQLSDELCGRILSEMGGNDSKIMQWSILLSGIVEELEKNNINDKDNIIATSLLLGERDVLNKKDNYGNYYKHCKLTLRIEDNKNNVKDIVIIVNLWLHSGYLDILRIINNEYDRAEYLYKPIEVDKDVRKSMLINGIVSIRRNYITIMNRDKKDKMIIKKDNEIFNGNIVFDTGMLSLHLLNSVLSTYGSEKNKVAILQAKGGKWLYYKSDKALLRQEVIITGLPHDNTIKKCIDAYIDESSEKTEKTEKGPEKDRPEKKEKTEKTEKGPEKDRPEKKEKTEKTEKGPEKDRPDEKALNKILDKTIRELVERELKTIKKEG